MKCNVFLGKTGCGRVTCYFMLCQDRENTIDVICFVVRYSDFGPWGEICKMEKIGTNETVMQLRNALRDNRWKEDVLMERRLQFEFV